MVKNTFKNKILNNPSTAAKGGLFVTGFTIIELIMVIVIVGIIAGVVAPFMANYISYWNLVRVERDLMFSTRFAMNRMVREIREIQNVASITTAATADFAFTRFKADGTTETVELRQTGGTLLRNTNTLADDLQNSGGLVFTYLDADGNTTSVTTDMRMVRIRLTLVSGDITVTLRSLARFRNI